MPHIHAGIDFVVAAFVVHQSRVLMVYHNKLDSWMPLGGHIELDEIPDHRLQREIEEESGLLLGINVEVYQSTEDLDNRCRIFPNNDIHHSHTLLRPWAIDLHNFPPVPGHRHVAFVYFCRSTTCDTHLSNGHANMAWMDHDKLEDPTIKMNQRVRVYGHTAITTVSMKHVPNSISGPCALYGLQPNPATT